MKALCRLFCSWVEEASIEENTVQKEAAPAEVNSFQRPQLSWSEWERKLGNEGKGKGWEREKERERECGVWFIARPLLRDKWYLWRVKEQQLSVQIMG